LNFFYFIEVFLASMMRAPSPLAFCLVLFKTKPSSHSHGIHVVWKLKLVATSYLGLKESGSWICKGRREVWGDRKDSSILSFRACLPNTFHELWPLIAQVLFFCVCCWMFLTEQLPWVVPDSHIILARVIRHNCYCTVRLGNRYPMVDKLQSVGQLS